MFPNFGRNSEEMGAPKAKAALPGKPGMLVS
jgi:hypothetical protein